MTEATRVLLGDGLFTPTEPGEDGQIIATHCRTCGDYFFPRSFTCHNPECVEQHPRCFCHLGPSYRITLASRS